MYLRNNKLSLKIREDGIIDELKIIDDKHDMNWVITENYLNDVGFFSQDKLFGNFEVKAEDKIYNSKNCRPIIDLIDKKCIVTYKFNLLNVVISYDLNHESRLIWNIKIYNKMNAPLKIQEFCIWSSFSYLMFRDHDVNKNIFHSAAVFPSISPNYSKIALMRRTVEECSLGLYQLKGETLSVGSYCDFQNKFFEDISPSLDGLVYYNMILSSKEDERNNNWLYPLKQVTVPDNTPLEWEYAVLPISDQEDFYKKASELGHPIFEYPDTTLLGQEFNLKYLGSKNIRLITIQRNSSEIIDKEQIYSNEGQEYSLLFSEPGEHKILIQFDDGTIDQLIINVLIDIKKMIENRVDYLCNVSYKKNYGEYTHIFTPESNQGESLGKLGLILKKNLIDKPDISQIEKVEKSIHDYVLKKWFIDSNLSSPRNLYGEFYRVMDYEYLGHVLYLLSKVPDEYLKLENSKTYLEWSAKVIELRINPEMHSNFRAKEESEMLGVFFLYIDDVLRDLAKVDQLQYEKLSLMWQNNLLKILEEKGNYSAAVTEHYFDNAGFGPAAASLANAGYRDESLSYANLLLANIGFSNDFRMQNPDRWWESLSYMIHALWGGISAAASLDVYHNLKDPRFLEASYRAFMGVLYCYDSNATSTTFLKEGEAASTFSCAYPHMNRPDLAHKRFGQDTFAKDGGIFSQIFSEDNTQTSDWDMGEELIAYLDRFGQDAYCYYDSSRNLKLVNCSFVKEKDVVVIKNNAPYPRFIYLLKEEKLIALDDKVPLFEVENL